MSTQRGNVKKSRPPKHQNKGAWKNVYHDTSIRTKQIVNTEVSGVCRRCKDIIDWRIKYKKYKPLTQPKTCASCKQKKVKKAYNTFCQDCSSKDQKCAKCGEKKEIVLQPSLPKPEQASEERKFQFELEMLPERKRRTVLRLQEKGLLTPEILATLKSDGDDYDLDMTYSDDDDDDDGSEVTASESKITSVVKSDVKGQCSETNKQHSIEKDIVYLDLNKD